jgi:hypothetical protein
MRLLTLFFIIFLLCSCDDETVKKIIDPEKITNTQKIIHYQKYMVSFLDPTQLK